MSTTVSETGKLEVAPQRAPHLNLQVLDGECPTTLQPATHGPKRLECVVVLCSREVIA